MSGKFIRIKKIVIPIITLIILTSQIAGCSIISSNEMVEMINQGQSITIELPRPAYEISIIGQQKENTDWVQLDQLKTFNNGFRQDFDTLFNINTVSENNIHGKSGCLYVDGVGDRNGNTTLEDALRNKVFVTKYWNDVNVKQQLIDIASQAYTDVDGNNEFALLGSLNAYYNLLPDAINTHSFNGGQSLSREQFYTLVFKTEEGVRPIEINEVFEKAIGGQTEYSKYAQEVEEYGFLRVENKSLDENSFRGSISRAEAVYMMVNKHFPDKLAEVTGKEKAFKDTKNVGNLALKVGFKERDKGTKEIIAKDRWQSYTLAFMVQNPNKGMQEDLYKPMVVAKELGLITGEESRWDEPISKEEAIQLLVNTHLTKNSLYGYLSEVEYGRMNINKFNVSSEDIHEVIGIDEDGFSYGQDWTEVPEGIVPADPDTIVSNGLTLSETKLALEHFEKALKEIGLNEQEIQDELDKFAKELGTNIGEINRLPENEQPTNVENTRNQGQSNNSSSDSVNNTPNDGGNTNISSDKLELKGDKWHTKEEKEAARERAIANGDLRHFEQRVREWEVMSDEWKEFMVSPYVESGTLDTSGMKNPFK